MKFLINKVLGRLGYGISKTRNLADAKISFSQCGEDLLVQYIFMLKGIEKPSYIDIGANDPYQLSNTAIFYEKGSRGLNIDANPLLIDRFKIHRPEDQNLNIGVGAEEEELDFFIINDHTLSSFSRGEVDKILATGKYFVDKVVKIKLISINRILDKYCDGKFPDFLSLDVEGIDFEIVKSIDFDRHWPKVICVEAAEYSARGDGARKNDLINFIVSKGYTEYANTNLNAILVKNEFWTS
jgi:FkbM family methyltransferase